MGPLNATKRGPDISNVDHNFRHPTHPNIQSSDPARRLRDRGVNTLDSVYPSPPYEDNTTHCRALKWDAVAIHGVFPKPNGPQTPPHAPLRRERHLREHTLLSPTQKSPKHELATLEPNHRTQLKELTSKPQTPSTPAHRSAKEVNPSGGYGTSRVRATPLELQNGVFFTGVTLRQRLADLEEWCTLGLDVDRIFDGDTSSEEWGTITYSIWMKVNAALTTIAK